MAFKQYRSIFKTIIIGQLAMVYVKLIFREPLLSDRR